MKDTTITFRLSEAEKQKIVIAAAAKGVSASQYIREVIANMHAAKDEENFLNSLGKVD